MQVYRDALTATAAPADEKAGSYSGAYSYIIKQAPIFRVPGAFITTCNNCMLHKNKRRLTSED